MTRDDVVRRTRGARLVGVIALVPLALGACSGAGRWTRRTDDAGWTWVMCDPWGDAECRDGKSKQILVHRPGRKIQGLSDELSSKVSLYMTGMVFVGPPDTSIHGRLEGSRPTRGTFPRRARATGQFRDDYFVYRAKGPRDDTAAGWHIGDRVRGSTSSITCPGEIARTPALTFEAQPVYALWATDLDRRLAMPAPLRDTLVVLCRATAGGGEPYIVAVPMRAGEEGPTWVDAEAGGPMVLWFHYEKEAWQYDLEAFAAYEREARSERAQASARYEKLVAEDRRRAAARDRLDQVIEPGRYCVAWQFKPRDDSAWLFITAELEVTEATTVGDVRWPLEAELSNRFGTALHAGGYEQVSSDGAAFGAYLHAVGSCSGVSLPSSNRQGFSFRWP